jgi:UDP-N-acetylglucosamine 4,6-dehydratase/5-epimerase
MFNGKVILITGGTGSFGKKCTETILERYAPKKLIIFSRDEFKQFEMAQRFPESTYPCIRFFLGDVRDKERLSRAFQGVDYVIHAAALKQVPAAEYNPTECIKTNVDGAQNIINVAADRHVKKVLALSTDKAVNPINLYGATKLCSDKLFVAANNFVAQDQTRFGVVRYGNVLGSRGSVIPLFLKKKQANEAIPVTDPNMTRFWITLEQGVEFVLKCLEHMEGGEVFVPKIPSMSILDMVEAIASGCKKDIVGIRPGEKLHELMISRDDARKTVEFDDHYVIQPDSRYFERPYTGNGGRPVAADFEYNSGTNDWKLGVKELRELLAQLEFNSGN